jgi:uncharacterized protein (DUF302 family)
LLLHSGWLPPPDLDYGARTMSEPTSPRPAAHGGSAPPDLETVPSALGVTDAVAAIEHAVTSAGMKIFAKIDQAAEARSAGLTMRAAVVVFFGNPKAGTPLMVARPTVAIDLPLKTLVWEDESGATRVTLNTPELLVRRHGLDEALAAKLAPAGDLIKKAVSR